MSDDEKRAWITLILKQHFFENDYYLVQAVADLMTLFHDCEEQLK
ncbi:hypothetical protein LCGC14_0895080 [marine sediment metagenome]|uniref:Uncharacterized protein n=1 Tax=marine sediment metagenome TaxID=412755 RepID=A0A0F9S534_9ZZZZ